MLQLTLIIFLLYLSPQNYQYSVRKEGGGNLSNYSLAFNIRLTQRELMRYRGSMALKLETGREKKE